VVNSSIHRRSSEPVPFLWPFPSSPPSGTSPHAPFAIRFCREINASPRPEGHHRPRRLQSPFPIVTRWIRRLRSSTRARRLLSHVIADSVIAGNHRNIAGATYLAASPVNIVGNLGELLLLESGPSNRDPVDRTDPLRWTGMGTSGPSAPL
jgi:hypothetical protein